MAYENHDANIIKATLERVITERGLPGSGLSDLEAREALAALVHIVKDWLPEGESHRRLSAIE